MTLQEPTYRAYKDKSLGAFIDQVLLPDATKRKRTYKATTSDTISRKGDFMERIIDSTKSFKDLSNEAKVLTESIYNFISQHNPA